MSAQRVPTVTWIEKFGVRDRLVCVGLWLLLSWAAPVAAAEPVLTVTDTLPGQFQALAVRDMVFTSDGTQLYAVGNETTFGRWGGIARFARDSATGALRYEPAAVGAGLAQVGAAGVAIAPDERFLYVTSHTAM